MKSNYPNRERSVRILLAAAEAAVSGTTDHHPVDLANAMSVAVEAAGNTLDAAIKEGVTW